MVKDLSPPVTLVMLLSMAKLQKGQEHSDTDFAKRWQTPADVVQQTIEAIDYLESRNQSCEELVYLYTNSLYHQHDTKLAHVSHVENHKRMSTHRRQTQTLLEQHNIRLKTVVWDDIVQAQPNFEQSRSAVINYYQTDADFRAAVQDDNTKRDGVVDPISDKAQPNSKKPIGSKPLASDEFVLEETLVFAGLGSRHIQHPDIDPDHKIVICYPGKPLRSLQILMESMSQFKKSAQIFKHSPDDFQAHADAFTWLDVSTVAAHEVPLPTPPVLERKVTSNPSQQGHKFNRFAKFMTQAIALTAPVALGIGLYAQNAIQPEDTVTIKKNDYKISVQLRKHNGVETLETLIYKKQDDGSWGVSEIGFNENEETRPLLFREDLGSARNITAECNRITGRVMFEAEPYSVTDSQPTSALKSGTFKNFSLGR